MRATRLTATAAAAACAVVPAVMGLTGAEAAPTEDADSTFVVTDHSDQGRELEVIRSKAADYELEIIRGHQPRPRTLTVRTSNKRELEVVRGMSTSQDELEITRVKRHH